MARAWILKAKSLLPVRHVEVKPEGQGMSKLVEPSNKSTRPQELAKGGEKAHPERYQSLCWLPHPRTGIYFPKGQEWVMEDVPTHAASFDGTYWLRNYEGVDRPDPPYEICRNER